MVSVHFTDAERRIIEECDTPEKVQRWLMKNTHYNHTPHGHTVQSFRNVVRSGVCHCMEAALAAAAILEPHGYPPLILSLEDTGCDHMLYLYRRENNWGTIAQTNTDGFGGRQPIFETIEEITSTYAIFYGRTVQDVFRGYTVYDLSDRKPGWQTAETDLWEIDDLFFSLAHRAWNPKDGRNFYIARQDKNVEWLPDDHPEALACRQREEQVEGLRTPVNGKHVQPLSSIR